MSKKIIVVGLSAASVSFVTKLRSFDKESEIICFSAENDFPYNRCLLADFLTNDITEEGLFLKPKEFFSNNNIQIYLNSRVTKIDFERQMVFVDQKNYSYEYLFLGVGARSVVPSFMNTLHQGVFQFHALRDIKNIQKYLNDYKPKTVTVIGAGLNGMEVASSLQEKGLNVTIIESAENILSSQVDQDIAQWLLKNSLAAHGVKVITGHKVITLCFDETVKKVIGVQLETGSIIASDMVVVTVGSIVNNELMHNTSLNMLYGSVVVDEYLRTNITNVFAAGDVCLVQDIVTKQLTRSMTWSDAMLQGLCAATNFGSTPRSYQGIIGLRDSYFFGKDFFACGKTTGIDGYDVIKKIDEQNIEVIYSKDNKVKGFVLIGDVSRVGILKKKYILGEDI